MKTLDEYRKEVEKDPKARRRLKKLEKEFLDVENSLTEEELVKYGLKPAPESNETEEKNAASEKAADTVIDLISRKV